MSASQVEIASKFSVFCTIPIRKTHKFRSRPLPAALVDRGLWPVGNARVDFYFFHTDALTALAVEKTISSVLFWGKGEIMRVYRLAMCLAVIGLTMSLGYSTSQAQALPSLACAVGMNIHPGARTEPPHYRPVHCRRSRLQVRVVL